MSRLFAQTDGLRSSASLHDRVATDLSHVLGADAPGLAGVQTSHGQIAAGVSAALSNALDARLGTVQAAADVGETISELLRKAAQMYEDGDHEGAEKLRAAAEALDGQRDTQGAAGAPAGSGAGGAVGGAPANGAVGPPGGDQMVGQMLGQVGQQVGQLVSSMTAPLLGLAQGLQQVPQMVAQGVQQAGRKDETLAREDGGDESERTGERTEEDAEEPSEPGRAEPKAEAAPSGSTGAVRAPEMPTGAEPPRPAQTRPQVG
ncbi:hypothetical protein AU184_13110 [Mycolicibacterium novocastrense]|uniref:ESX-1 secretion-associated protein n=1 Tax=Mycolicibacterium novocastrense TaxID=59813 RepID=UPI0007477669|nr:ESX-1 secretion-associated protein [Mycolicibacterium novocastrense]KUH76719.1 hypothetical protein AU183_05860 [Mycolicibacterium novocastrense]KUH77953.1 hypothetical protein AU072_08190 [Mycolicibacterium novocastrense]KUH79286.1 hypothetical protein AU184_13110 [Mycolicibacterium novocastrense]